MEKSAMYGHIDHTLLRATSTWAEIQKLCDEAIQYGTASVCIPPSFVGRVHQTYGDKINICTVIGFPLGYNTTAVKVFEAKEALREGAGEIDMVINLGDLKDGHDDAVLAEIQALKEAVGSHILKVIIETCYLTEDEKKRMCDIVTRAGADYIKTSTGFGTGGATMADVELFKRHIGPKVKIKAAGGVKTRAELEAYLEAGCDRIGTSSGIRLLNEEA